METELPMLLGAAVEPDHVFTFHSSRVRMRDVTEEGLRGMVGETDRAASELADAPCEVVAFACLVAVMAQGPGAHVAAERQIRDALDAGGSGAAVVSSAGALIEAVQQLGANRVALVTPYMKPLTQAVIEYLGDVDIEVVDAVSLEISDNCAVGSLAPDVVESAFRELDLSGADAVVLSACVQMPSLPIVQSVHEQCGLPVVTAATATAASIMRTLGLYGALPGIDSAVVSA
jgi:maleate isomerase